MEYTVKRLARLAGVSVRTLHYYDEIGLLRPTRVGANGYRYYGEPALLRLQQILFYRELGFGLEDIAAVLEAPDFDVLSALEAHRGALLQRLGRLRGLVATVEGTIAHLKGERVMDAQELFAGFSEAQQAEYEKEAEARWGESVRESSRRWKDYSAERRKEILAEAGAIYQDFAARLDEPPGSPAVQAVTARWHANLRHFYEPSVEVLRGLAEAYNADPAFNAFFAKLDTRLPPFIREAVEAYCAGLDGER